jgi:hypothetical protein
MAITKAQWDYFKRVYDNAPFVECTCGCGTLIKSKDKYARNKLYINGHNPRKYTNPKESNRVYERKVRTKRAEYKENIIIERGGKCEICGYKYDGRNISAFDFHHKDPSEKEFNLSIRGISEKAILKANKEIEKCLVVCSNCNRLFHNGYFD